MPLLDRQRRGVVLGSIRIGTRVTAVNAQGREYQRPEKLSTFRLTSPDVHKINAAAELYGGEVKPWTPGETRGGQQWEVVTTADQLPVRVPPGMPVEQQYELWAGRPVVRQRLCNGFTESMRGGTCVCPPDLMERKSLAAEGKACKPTTRLSLILAELPGLGVWTLTSTGDSAADELAAVAETLRLSELAGVMMPATLRLEQRESRGSGKVHHYAVPVLDVGASLAALESGYVPAAPAIGSGTQRQLTAAAESPAADVIEGSVAERPGTAASGSAPPTTAQETADRAREATTIALVQRLGAYAREKGWLDEYVADADGVQEPLENALYAALERVGGVG